MIKRQITWDEIFGELNKVDKIGRVIYGVPKAGMILTGFLQRAKMTPYPVAANTILDDLIDSGATRDKYQKEYPNKEFIALFDKQKMGTKDWLVFPWEAEHPAGEDSVEQNIVRQLEYIGEDAKREGLKGTPDRIVRSWNELYKGYGQDPWTLITDFDAETYDQIVLLKDIELYSMCEHHMLPFLGKAHVAYIPNGRVLGISKLARLVDIYARRLQIQERIGERVTDFLMEECQAKGAVCIIEAQHLCMRMRGCSKQNSTMVTSSLKGVFFDLPEARQELMLLIRG